MIYYTTFMTAESTHCLYVSCLLFINRSCGIRISEMDPLRFWGSCKYKTSNLSISVNFKVFLLFQPLHIKITYTICNFIIQTHIIETHLKLYKILLLPSKCVKFSSLWQGLSHLHWWWCIFDSCLKLEFKSIKYQDLYDILHLNTFYITLIKLM